jgi:hypothetical protein
MIDMQKPSRKRGGFLRLGRSLHGSLPGSTRQSMTTLNAQSRTIDSVARPHGGPGQARA